MTMTENESEQTQTDEPVVPDDLSTLTVAKLRELADRVGLHNVPRAAPKAVLVEAIEEYRARVRETVDAAVERAVTTEEIEAEAVAETDEPLPDDVVEAESTALALREEPVVATPALLPTTAEFDAMLAIAEKIASTQMVPVAYRGKPDDVLAAILTGREMGLGPMQSLRDIYVVDGKPSLSANLLLARLREGGVVILESKCDNDHAWIRARRRDTGEIAEVEWTYAEAEQITYRKKGGATGKLVEKDNWRNYRPDMLWARAVGRLARRLGPDLIGAAMPYTSEEVQDWDLDEQTTRESIDRVGERPFGSDRRTGQWIAPKDWTELFVRLVEQLGDQDTVAWMEELAEKAYRMPSIADVVKAPEETISGDRKRDLWQRLGRVLRGLEDADRPVDGAGLRLTPGLRGIVQQAVAEAFDRTLALDGPAWALDPDEAATRPSREAAGGVLRAVAEAATETSSERSEAESGPEDAPAAAPGPDGGDDLDGVVF